MTTSGRAQETNQMRSSQMALPPEEMAGVIINLSLEESIQLFDWLLNSIDNVELAISQTENDEVRNRLYEQLSTLAIVTQSCTSAVALNYIYEPPEKQDRHHFIHMHQIDAMNLIRMLERTPDDSDIISLRQNIIRQVDKAFLEKYEFANVPAA